MAKARVFRGDPERKQVALFDNFLGGINTTNIDSQVKSNEFRVLENVELVEEGRIQKRKGWKHIPQMDLVLSRYINADVRISFDMSYLEDGVWQHWGRHVYNVDKGIEYNYSPEYGEIIIGGIPDLGYDLIEFGYNFQGMDRKLVVTSHNKMEYINDSGDTFLLDEKTPVTYYIHANDSLTISYNSGNDIMFEGYVLGDFKAFARDKEEVDFKNAIYYFNVLEDFAGSFSTLVDNPYGEDEFDFEFELIRTSVEEDYYNEDEDPINWKNKNLLVYEILRFSNGSITNSERFKQGAYTITSSVGTSEEFKLYKPKITGLDVLNYGGRRYIKLNQMIPNSENFLELYQDEESGDYVLHEITKENSYAPNPIEVKHIGFNLFSNDPFKLSQNIYGIKSILSTYIVPYNYEEIDNVIYSVIPTSGEFGVRLLVDGNDDLEWFNKMEFKIYKGTGTSKKYVEADITFDEAHSGGGLAYYKVKFKEDVREEVTLEFLETEEVIPEDPEHAEDIFESKQAFMNHFGNVGSDGKSKMFLRSRGSGFYDVEVSDPGNPFNYNILKFLDENGVTIEAKNIILYSDFKDSFGGNNGQHVLYFNRFLNDERAYAFMGFTSRYVKRSTGPNDSDYHYALDINQRTIHKVYNVKGLVERGSSKEQSFEDSTTIYKSEPLTILSSQLIDSSEVGIMQNFNKNNNPMFVSNIYNFENHWSLEWGKTVNMYLDESKVVNYPTDLYNPTSNNRFELNNVYVTPGPPVSYQLNQAIETYFSNTFPNRIPSKSLETLRKFMTYSNIGAYYVQFNAIDNGNVIGSRYVYPNFNPSSSHSEFMNSLYVPLNPTLTTYDVYAIKEGTEVKYFKYTGSKEPILDWNNINFGEYLEEYVYEEYEPLVVYEYLEPYLIGTVSNDPVIPIETGKMKAIVIRDRLVMYGGNTIVWSDIFSTAENDGIEQGFTYFPNNNWLTLSLSYEDEIQKIAYYRGSHIIFTKETIYRLSGDFVPEELEVILINDSIGCIAPDSISAINNTLIFMTKDGLYALRQNYFMEGLENVVKIDDKIKGIIPYGTKHESVVIDETYLLHILDEDENYIKTVKQYYNMINNSKEIPYTVDVYNKKPESLFTYRSEMYSLNRGMMFKYNVGYSDFRSEYDNIHGIPVEESYYNMKIKTPNINLEHPLHEKKFKNIFVNITSRDIVNLKMNCYVDFDKVISTDDKEVVMNFLGELEYVDREQANLKTEGQMVLGFGRLNENYLGEDMYQVHKLSTGSKGRVISFEFNSIDPSNIALDALSIVYKLGKMRGN